MGFTDARSRFFCRCSSELSSWGCSYLTKNHFERIYRMTWWTRHMHIHSWIAYFPVWVQLEASKDSTSAITTSVSNIGVVSATFPIEQCLHRSGWTIDTVSTKTTDNWLTLPPKVEEQVVKSVTNLNAIFWVMFSQFLILNSDVSWYCYCYCDYRFVLLSEKKIGSPVQNGICLVVLVRIVYVQLLWLQIQQHIIMKDDWSTIK